MAINNLTYGLLKKRLQIANCCAAVQGMEIIEKQKKGINCDSGEHKITVITNLIDSIKGYACITPATPATLTYSAITWIGGTNFNLQITYDFLIGGTNSRIVFGQTSVDGAFAALVTLFNGLGYGIIATYNSVTNVFTLINPTDVGTAGNVRHASFSTAGAGQPTIPDPSGIFTGGTDGNTNTTFDDTNTCLTTIQINNILEKLGMLCDAPCTSYVNFES